MKTKKKYKKTFFYNRIITKKSLKELLFWVFQSFGMERAGFVSDCLKTLGFYYATQGGFSLSIEDLKVPPMKTEVLNQAQRLIAETEYKTHSGKITEVEKYIGIIDNWNLISEKLKNNVVKYFKRFDPLNPIYMMAFSGARGNLSQIRQLVGMRGLMAGSSGELIDIPIIKNFREGLTVTDYMISAYGARKGIVDTSLRTADSGYLTRRLVDVAQDVLIREIDCKTQNRILLFPFNNSNDIAITLKQRIIGRTLGADLYCPNSNKLIGKNNQQINLLMAEQIENLKISKILVRSPLTCELGRSICQNCYGWNLAYEKLVDLGEAIGIIAAQSIGEPGTQLTMRTFHTGGVFTAQATLQIYSKISGRISLPKNTKIHTKRINNGFYTFVLEMNINMKIVDFKNQISNIFFNYDTTLFVKNYQFIKKGQVIAEFSKNNKTNLKNRTKKDIQTDFSGELYFAKVPEINYLTNNNENVLVWILNGKVISLENYFKLIQKNNKFVAKYNPIAETILSNTEQCIVKLKEKANQNDRYTSIRLLLNSETLNNVEIFSAKKTVAKNNLANDYENLFIKKDQEYFSFLNQKFFNISEKNNLLKLFGHTYKTNISGTPYFLKTKLRRGRYASEIIQIKLGGGIIFVKEDQFIINKKDNKIYPKSKTWVKKGLKLTKNLCAKYSGFIEIIKVNEQFSKVIIKYGTSILLKRKIPQFHKKIFYPGEVLFGKYKVKKLAYTEVLKISNNWILLLSPIVFYELPKISKNNFKKFNKIMLMNHNSGKFINVKKSVNLVNINFELSEKINTYDENFIKPLCELNFKTKKKFVFNLICNYSKTILPYQFIPAGLNLKNFIFSLSVQNNQYIEENTIIGKFQFVLKKEFLIKSLKEKNYKQFRRVLIISNDNLKTIFSENENKINKSIKFINAGKKITKQLKLNNACKTIKKTSSELTFQTAKPFLISNLSKMFWNQKDFVTTNESLGFLFSEKTVTGDIVQGLPKVEEILEARRAKIEIYSNEHAGFIINSRNENKFVKFIFIDQNKINFYNYIFEKKFEFENQVTSNQFLTPGQPVNLTTLNPHVLLSKSNSHYKKFLKFNESIGLKGKIEIDKKENVKKQYKATYRSLRKIQSYLLNKIQNVYYSQGVVISDKHLETIVKQMTSKVIIKSCGDTSLLPGEYIELNQMFLINQILSGKNNNIIVYEPILLGITKASLIAESFISAASFQETVRILIEAAIEGKVDWLRGLKENVIVGKLIPAGTGFKAYNNISNLTLRLPIKQQNEQKSVILKKN